MIQTNANLNSARSMANNGQKFIEDTATHTGVWSGFQPHKDGCKVAEITITSPSGKTITQTHASVSSWIGTTKDLDCYMGAGVVPSVTGGVGLLEKGYITSIKLALGACTAQNDTLAP